MSEQQQEQQQEQEQKKKKKGGILVAIVIIALIGVIIYLLLSRQPEPENERRGVLVTPENVEDVLEEANKSVPEGYYTVTMNSTWHFANSREASYDSVIENVEGNTHDVYFDVVLAEDEGKVLYSSPVIPRGGRLEAVELDEALDAGTYDCVVIYHLVDEEQNTISLLRVALQIVIEG